MSHGGDDGLPEEHEEHVNHEAWVIPYADLLTLLMAMFIALFAMSTVDQSKFKELAIGFNEALGGGDLKADIGGSGKATSAAVGAGNGEGPFTGGRLVQNEANLTETQLASLLSGIAADQAAGSAEKQSLKDVQKSIEEKAKTLGLGGKVQTKQLNGGLQVTLLTDQVVFQSGSAEIQLTGKDLLTLIAGVLKNLKNPIRIDGHTDNVPISGRYRDNQELSSARANEVYRFFAEKGIDIQRMSPVGMGDKKPIASNATAAGKAQNRRVEIIVESLVKQQVIDRAGLNDEPADDTETTPINNPVGGIGGGVGGAKPSIEPNLSEHHG
jgi:chemotaxis protein MotB